MPSIASENIKNRGSLRIIPSLGMRIPDVEGTTIATSVSAPTIELIVSVSMCVLVDHEPAIGLLIKFEAMKPWTIESKPPRLGRKRVIMSLVFSCIFGTN
jgi:hypothetical protein